MNDNFLDINKLKLLPNQEEKLSNFEFALLEKNKQINLVSASDIPNLRTRHILDSLIASVLIKSFLKPGSLIADCGSGAGFPGLPLAIALPEYRFVLLDSKNKRCLFLKSAISAISLSNVKAVQKRIGEGQAFEEYNAVIERAMGKLYDILPICSAILKKGGFFFAWQTKAQVLHMDFSLALKRAGLNYLSKYRYKLPNEENDRFIAVFVKI